MSAMTHAPSSRDLLGSWRNTALLYGLPSLLIVVTSISFRSSILTFDVEGPWRGGVWALACAVMGGACLVNAVRCGRVHCYFTGPFLLAVGVAAILQGAGVLPLGEQGWNLLGLILLVGTGVLMTVPEWLLGRYRRLAA